MNDLMTKSFMSYVDLKKEALKDLEAANGDGPSASSGGGGGGGVSSSMEMSSAPTDANLRRFFEEAELAREEMTSIREALIRLQEANEEGKALLKPEYLRSLRARVNSDIVSVLKKSKAIRDRLEAMDRSNADNRRLSGCRAGTPADRTRTSVTNGLRKKLKDLMLDFQCLRQRIMSEHREAVERRYYAVTGEVPGEEVIDGIISRGESEDILRKAVEERGATGEVSAAVHEIQDRQDAAREVERSLLELHQVFLDMAVMVEAQGEQMDDIEHHVSSAASYVKGGAEELGRAKRHQRSGRRCLCIGAIVLLLLILLVVVPIMA